MYLSSPKAEPMARVSITASLNSGSTTARPDTSNLGVVLLVMSSVFEKPESSSVNRLMIFPTFGA